MADINLLQNDSYESGVNAGYAATVLARLLLLLVMGVIAIYAVLYFDSWRSDSSLQEVTSKISTKQAESLTNKDRNELVTRQEQLAELEVLIDKHVYWSYLMPELARVTLKSAQYTEIEAKSDGKLNLTVKLPSYEDIEKYMQIFDLPEYNQQFSNVKITGINKVQTESTVETELRLELTFNPEYIKGRL